MPHPQVTADGAKLRELREGKGWTRERLARFLQVHPNTIVNWEKGSPIPLERAIDIAMLMGVELADIGIEDVILAARPPTWYERGQGDLTNRLANIETLLSDLARRCPED
jgi:DNA-binding XRE family transcriptional regulator